ncbi:MAG: dihydrolipoyl dehydrogenase [Myxococcales bacterium]|nr:dihydrolipoyl dehydrogenase [Myxococcales bacterium]
MSHDIREVDVAILGAGTAGLTARKAVKKARASVLSIDPGPFGTTCARVGCMPSKLVIAAAEMAHAAQHGAMFGVHAEGVRVDGREVMARVQRERDQFAGHVVHTVRGFEKDGELLTGRAKVIGEGRLLVDDTTEVRYRGLVVATGTAPFVPPPFRGISYLTNESVFELEDLPESLLVVGLGAIGLELGQAFHRLGVRTTIISIGGLIGPLGCPEVLDAAKAIFSAELDMHPDYELGSIEPDGDGVHIRFTDSNGRARDERYARVLMAAGRRSTLGDLGLESLGIARGEDGRWPVDPDTLQLGDQPIFVAGDAHELHPIMHEAADDGRLAGSNAARFPEVLATPRRTPLAVVFSDPQIAIVGGGHATACKLGAVAGSYDLADQGRARIHDQNRGRFRLYATKHDGRLVGAELLGPRAEHIGHLLAWAVQRGLTVDDALSMPFYHPVVEEGLRSALYDLNASLRHGEPIRCRVTEVGVGA